MRVVTASLIVVNTYFACLCSRRATPYLPVTCPFPNHHPDAFTELLVIPKLVTALAFVLYVFWA